jgi:hypothetical protein
MIRALLFVPVLASAALLLPACSFSGGTKTVEGSGVAAEEVRSVGEFSAVSFAIPGTLRIEQADRHSLRIEADDNLIDHIVTEISDGSLRIRTERTRLVSQQPIRVFVTAPTLTSIESAGSGSVEAPNLRVGDLAVSLAGSGDTRLPGLEAEELRIQLAGSGTVEVSGNARRQVLSLAGSGGVEASGLETETVSANVAGSGSAFVQVRDRLTANLVGSGSVRYVGDPQVESNTIGSGRVVRVTP